MSDRRGASAVLDRLDTVGTVELAALVRRATEVHATFAPAHRGDVVGVAAEVQRLGFAIERVQQR